MTEAQDRTGRSVKWMRRAARILALSWAALWTVLYGFLVLPQKHWVPAAYWPLLVAIMLASWVAASVPWRWERAGATLLLLATFALPAAGYAGHSLLLWEPSRSGVAVLILLLVWLSGLVPMALLGSVAGSLFLVTWRLSRTSGGPQDSVKECSGRR